MFIFSKLRENAKSLKAAKQKQKQQQQPQAATVEKQNPELGKEKGAQPQPQPQSEVAPTVAVQEVKHNEAQPAVTPSKRTSWRPSLNRTKSSESMNKLMSATALRPSTSAPSLRTLKHRSSDLSIESVMLSSDFSMTAAKQGASTDTMMLKSRNSLLAPNQFTYDPSKTPTFVARKKGRPRRLHPSSRSSSYIRLQQIEPTVEENEDGETVESSSTSTKSGSSGSSARSQYLEKKRSAQSSANTLSDAASSSRRASWASSDRSASSVSDITSIAEVYVPVPVVHVQVQVTFADPPVTTIPAPNMSDEDHDKPRTDAADAEAVVSVMEDTPPATPLPTQSMFSLRKKRSWFRKKHDSGTITIF